MDNKGSTILNDQIPVTVEILTDPMDSQLRKLENGSPVLFHLCLL